MTTLAAQQCQPRIGENILLFFDKSLIDFGSGVKILSINVVDIEVKVTVEGHFNPGLFNPKLQPQTFQPRTFNHELSNPRPFNPRLSTMNFQTPD